MTTWIAAALAAAGLVLAVPAGAAEKKEEKKEPTFTQGKQGEAKDALEKSAGKKAEDVKVPAVSPPKPVKSP